jgi:phosphopantothenoylcysteine synthetase/decarboxylase
MAEKRILLGVTGSVAAVLTGKMVKALRELGEVRVIFTDRGRWFIDSNEKAGEEFEEQIPQVRDEYSGKHIGVYSDHDEWPELFEPKEDPIEHIELREWANCLVIAPLTANTLAKMHHGLCDNLLTSVVRAWDHQYPIVLAPAMNTKMWWNKPTPEQIYEMKLRGCIVVDPVEKDLACGETGMGAMAPISEIMREVRAAISRVGV